MSYKNWLKWGSKVGITAVFLLPIYWMATAALIPQGVSLAENRTLLSLNSYTFDNFQRMWQLLPMGQYTLNSLRVVLIAVPLTLITSSWAGLGISQLPRTAQRRWVLFSLMLLMVPGIALWSTRFLVYKQLGWLDSAWALIAPAWMGTSPFYVLMFYRAFRRTPTAVFEAARLEGATLFQIWRLIAFPIAQPTVVGVGLLSFVFYWGDFISPLLYISRENGYTLPVGLQLLQQMSPSDWPLLMAGAVFATAVPLLIFIGIQPYLARIGE